MGGCWVQYQFSEMEMHKLLRIAQRLENGGYCEHHAILIDIHINNVAERYDTFTRNKNCQNYIDVLRQISLLVGFDEACQLCEKCRMMRTD